MSRKRYDVAGKVVFVTGAARGIGLETARRLHAKGASVALVGLEPEMLERHAAELGARAAFFEADVSDYAAVEAAAEGTVERFGGIDVAVANAGLSFVGTLGKAPVEQFHRTIAVNLTGVFHTDRAVLPHVTARRGYILNIASLSAIANAPLMSSYSASKSGVDALSNVLRVEVHHTGVRVGCAYFGFIDTDLVRQSLAHEASKRLTRANPGFISRPLPLAKAIDTIERAVQRRSARVVAPNWVAPLLPLRGVIQPLIERRQMGTSALVEALRLAEADAGPEPDPLLGIAAPQDSSS